MRVAVSLIVLLAFSFLPLGCSTTRIVETWKEPRLQASDLHFKHVIAIAVLRDGGRRRIAEDVLAAAVTSTKVTPAYALVSQEDRADVERLRGVLVRNGVDGAITVKLVGVEDRQTYVPGSTRTHGGGYYGYYGGGAVVYDPGYVRNDTYVIVEISLYDVVAGTLLWTAESETLNPSAVGELMEGIVKQARKKLEDQGLLP